jgi:hypothetical protein
VSRRSPRVGTLAALLRTSLRLRGACEWGAPSSLWALAVFFMLGCNRAGTATWVVAKGSEGAILSSVSLGECPDYKDTVIEYHDGTYKALSVGTRSIRCGLMTSITFEVRNAARIEIEPPYTTRADDYVPFRVIAFDVRGALVLLGDKSAVKWMLPEGVTRSSDGGDIIPIVPTNTSPKLRGLPGKRTIEVEFDGLHAKREFNFVQR